MHPESQPLRICIPEAAHLLGISRAKLYQHIKAGKISTLKDGRRTLFTRAELERFVVAGSVNGAP